MAEYENQHFVPQSYLRRFSPEPAKKRLYAYDKVLRRSLGFVGIKSIASKSFFYDVPLTALKAGFNNDPHLEEKALKVLEDQLNGAIEVGLRVAAGRGAGLKERQTMSLAIAVQLIRTLDYRRSLVEGMQKLIEATLDSVLELSNPDLATKVRAQVNYDEDSASLLHAEFMWNPEFVSRIAATIYHRIWIVGLNNTAIPLYTSDSPVVLERHKPRQNWIPDPTKGPSFSRAIDLMIEAETPSIGEAGVEMVFPLSPRCALIVLENEHFKYLQERQGQVYSLQPPDVVRLNSLQVRRSNQQIYSTANDFSLVEELCSQDYDICSNSRPRLRMEKQKWMSAGN